MNHVTCFLLCYVLAVSFCSIRCALSFGVCTSQFAFDTSVTNLAVFDCFFVGEDLHVMHFVSVQQIKYFFSKWVPGYINVLAQGWSVK